MSNAKYYDGSKFVKLGPDSPDDLGITKEFIESLGINKASMGLDLVDNVKQMPISGGTFTGVAKAQSNTSYTTAQMRNVILSTSDAVLGSIQNGDIWIKYE